MSCKPTSEVRHRYHSQGLAAGGSALLDAINRGKVHLAKFILDAGEYDVVNTRDFNGKTPLIRAVYIKVRRRTVITAIFFLKKTSNLSRAHVTRDIIGAATWGISAQSAIQ